jgi:hypothetical protein
VRLTFAQVWDVELAQLRETSRIKSNRPSKICSACRLCLTCDLRYLPFFAVFLPAAAFGDFVAVFFAAAMFTFSLGFGCR